MHVMLFKRTLTKCKLPHQFDFDLELLKVYMEARSHVLNKFTLSRQILNHDALV